MRIMVVAPADWLITGQDQDTATTLVSYRNYKNER